MFPERFESVSPFEICTSKSIEEALLRIKKRFENDSKKENNLDFHNTRHTKDVMRRIDLILQAIRRANSELVSARDIEIGRVAAAFHDVVQDWEELPDEKSQKTTRRRFVGANEQKSADEAIAFIEAFEKEQNQAIFSEQEKEIIKEAIGVTVPGFNPGKNTVVQPNLKESSSLVARALALADIGCAGMDGKGQFLYEGDALFREENLDIKKALADGEELSEEKKEAFRKRMLGWTGFQFKFAQGRKDLFESEIAALPEEARESVRLLFSHFDESIDGAKELFEKRKNMSFEELAKDMGYV